MAGTVPKEVVVKFPVTRVEDAHPGTGASVWVAASERDVNVHTGVRPEQPAKKL